MHSQLFARALKVQFFFNLLDCYVANGVGYRGISATSESGQSCQNWASHQHYYNPQRQV